MENRMITTQYMLQKIMSKLGLRDVYDLPLHDIISWMGEALMHIGGYQTLERSTKKVKIVNYMGKYPEDLYSIVRVEGYPKFKDVRNGFMICDDDVEVTIEYDRFPIDTEGFPMFPNSASITEALVWYVAKYLSIQGKLPNRQISPQYCDSEWQWYCGQARAEGYTPTIDQWERMVNTFYRLIPMKDQYSQYFSGLNNSEDLKLDPINQYKYGQNYNNV